jgi:hypothetical protein
MKKKTTYLNLSYRFETARVMPQIAWSIRNREYTDEEANLRLEYNAQWQSLSQPHLFRYGGEILDHLCCYHMQFRDALIPLGRSLQSSDQP